MTTTTTPTPTPRSPGQVRRRRLLAGGAVLVVAAIVAVVLFVVLGGDDAAPEAPRPQGLVFRSAPGFSPPGVTVVKSLPEASSGDLFLAPKRLAPQAGPEIVDGDGQLVWFHRVPKGEAANSFRVQTYQGKPVLTWWEGHTDGTGHGHGTYYIADTTYRIIHTVHAGNGLQGDLHDFRLTPRGTALITIYKSTTGNLTAAHGPAHGKVIDSVVQEVDVKTGRVIFQWNSLDHVPVGESYVTPQTKFANSDAGAFDYFHINSVSKDAKGDYLVSGRNTDAIYKVDHDTGRVVWRLGGRKSDFEMGPGTLFAFQHDAEWEPGGIISLFDNSASPKVQPESRALLLRVDENKHTVSLARAFTHPEPISSDAEGNVERLPNGNYFVGWGLGGTLSEFTPDGQLVFDAKLPPEVESYRAYRYDNWHGHPRTAPLIAAKRHGDGLTAWASWNGATDVARWQVLVGPSAQALKPAGSADRRGFETAIGVPNGDTYVAVRALDARGHVLGSSAPIRAR